MGGRISIEDPESLLHITVEVAPHIHAVVVCVADDREGNDFFVFSPQLLREWARALEQAATALEDL